MPAEPVPADPGWDEDLAWLDRDPERETWLDRAREHDDPPGPEQYEDYAPLTAEELADPRQPARRDRARGHGSCSGEGAEAAGGLG
jgi:hypothetical protein